MNVPIHMTKANKVQFMQQINELCRANINPPYINSCSIETKKNLNLNLMTASTELSTGNWARCLHTNNNNALLYQMPFSQCVSVCVCVRVCVCVCVCVCV